MHRGERTGDGNKPRQRAPRSASSAAATASAPPASASGVDQGGPLRFGPGYSPWKDPTVLVLLAISLIAGLMFLGGATIGPALAGSDDGDGVFPVFDLLSGDDGDGAKLSLAANRTELTAGDPVAFTVTDANGSAAVGATVTVGGTAREVGEDGRTVVRIATAGPLTATATAPGANDTTLESNGVDLAVAHRTVQLGFETNRSVATAGEPIELTLVREETGDPVDGSIAAAAVSEGAAIPSQFEHVAGARLVVVPERAGTLYADGAVETDADETFATAELQMDVERRKVPLNLSITPTTLLAGESVTATVRNVETGDRIGATLAVGDRSIQTGPDGEVEITLDAAGDRTIEATAASTPSVRFTPDSSVVTVQRREVELAATADRSAITTGGSVGITVIRNDTGEPVDATVTVGDRALSTGADGSVETTVEDPGEYGITATAANTSAATFVATERTLTVTNATFELGDLDAPDPAQPGETVTVSTAVHNLGPADGSDTLVLTIDGRRVASVVSLAAEESSTVAFEIAAPADPGSYPIRIRGSDGSTNGTIVVE